MILKNGKKLGQTSYALLKYVFKLKRVVVHFLKPISAICNLLVPTSINASEEMVQFERELTRNLAISEVGKGLVKVKASVTFYSSCSHSKLESPAAASVAPVRCHSTLPTTQY